MDPARPYRFSRQLQVGGNSINYDLFRIANLPWKWEIAPVLGQTDTYTIEPVCKDTNESSTIGMTRGKAFKNDGKSCKYQYQVVGMPGRSANWKIVKDTSGPYSRSGSHLHHYFFRDRLLLEFISTIVQMSWNAVIIFQVLELRSKALFIFVNIKR